MAKEYELPYTGAELEGILHKVSEGGGGGASTWDELQGKPETFPPAEHTHDEYLKSIPSEYVTETELAGKGYITQHQDISGKANESDLNSHIGNTTAHITAAERTKWNQGTTDISQLSREIVNYLPKNQGSANVGKILVVGTDGNLVLTNMPEPSSGDVTGIIDEANNILLSGNLADGTYTLKYEVVDENGNVSYTEVGTLEVGAIPEPPASHTNLADPSSDDWKEGYRLSISSGSVSALAGHTTTNFIPCKAGDVLRIKGMTITGYAGNSTDASDAAKIVRYDSSKTKLGGLYGLPATTTADGYGAKVTTDGDISTYTIMHKNDGTQVADSTTAYIRIDGMLMDGYTAEDVIITINEEIAE